MKYNDRNLILVIPEVEGDPLVVDIHMGRRGIRMVVTAKLGGSVGGCNKL